MKLNKLLIFAIVLVSSASVFGQAPTPKPDAKVSVSKTASMAKLPSVKEILDKYVQATGGRAALEKIRTRTMKGTVELAPVGVKGTFEYSGAAPDKIYNKMTLGGIGDIIEAYDGKTAWSVNPLQGNRDKTGDELAQAKITADFHRELNFERLYQKMEVKGVEKVGEKEAYVVIATPTGLEPQTFYFDKQTGLLLREDMTAVSPEGKFPSKIYYDDYRETDGVKLPYKVRTVLPQFEFLLAVTEVKNGVKIDEAIFVKPVK